MHLKRSSMPKTWKMKRKGTKYLAKPLHNLKNSMTLLIALRDILKLGKTRREIRSILNSGKIKVNEKTIREDKFPIMLFDNLEINSRNYKLILKNKKFDFAETKDREKIVKIIGKKLQKKSAMQVNLSDGRNYAFKGRIKTGDSAVIDLKENKIAKILEMKPGCRILFISGKHAGEEGIAEKIEGKNITIKINKEEINAKSDNVMVVA